MKVGLITDTHIRSKTNLKENEDTVTVESVLQDLSEDFADQGVETVIHLGDIADESPKETYTDRVSQVVEHFDQFDFHMTLGNHDILAIEPTEFSDKFSLDKEELTKVIHRTDEESLILMNTATKIQPDQTEQEIAVGLTPDRGIELITQELEAGRDPIVFTHYPFQYSHIYQDRPIFNVHPEYTFPINNMQVNIKLRQLDSPSDIKTFCGHLHPERTLTVSTDPFSINTTIVEPIQQFSLSGDTVKWTVNTDIDSSDLIFEF